MIDHRPGSAAGKHVLRAIARRVGEPVWSRLWPRVEAVAERHATRVARQLRGELGDLRTELRAELAGLRETVDRLGALVERVEWTENEVRRIGPHVAAIDQRVAGLERAEPVAGGDAAEGRTLVDEIRSEHARIRARLSAVASYEHRIATMEQAVTAIGEATR
jgi:hypothetical protein